MWIFFVLLFFTGEDGIKQSDGALHPIIIKHIKGAISAFEYCSGEFSIIQILVVRK